MEKKIYSSCYGIKSRKTWPLIYVSASPGFGAGENSPRYFQLQPKLLVTASPAQKLQDSPQLGYLICLINELCKKQPFEFMYIKFFQLLVFQGVLSGTHTSLLFSSLLLVIAMIEWWHQRSQVSGSTFCRNSTPPMKHFSCFSAWRVLVPHCIYRNPRI